MTKVAAVESEQYRKPTSAVRPTKKAVAQRPRRGGRVTEERRREIVKLAAPLFLEHGYEHVSVDDIVAAIGGSKRTLYERFGGKAGLFEMVIREYCGNVSRDLIKDIDPKASIEKQLINIGTHFLNMILHSRILEQHRLMVAMGRSFPAVSQMFYEVGPQRAYSAMADWIAGQQKAGRLGPGDPMSLAELFLDMLTGKHQLALLTSSFKDTSPQAITATVKAAAKLFLRGAAP